MQDYQREFVEFLVRTGALGFGEYRLKSGRMSPYFFNAGMFNRGADVERLGYFYACAIRDAAASPLVVFGPAYKGIAICIATVVALQRHFGIDAFYCYDRKEVKDHGEGGWLVGRIPAQGDSIVLVDDVITDGATKADAIARLRGASDAQISRLVIALDRREANASGGNSVADLEEATGVEIRSIVTVHHILEHLPGREIGGRVALCPEDRQRMETYLSEYGIDPL